MEFCGGENLEAAELEAYRETCRVFNLKSVDDGQKSFAFLPVNGPEKRSKV